MNRNLFLAGFLGVVLLITIPSVIFSEEEPSFSESTTIVTSSATVTETIPSEADEIKPIGRTVPPFLFEIPQGTVDGEKYSSVREGGFPESKFEKSHTVSLPIIIRPTVDQEIEINFLTTYGKQRDVPKMPPGLDVKIEPSSLILTPGKDSQINMIIQTDSNALDGTYFQYIIGTWGDSNSFSASAVVLTVGEGSKKFITPWSDE